jgi:hypothetical protein
MRARYRQDVRDRKGRARLLSAACPRRRDRAGSSSSLRRGSPPVA